MASRRVDHALARRGGWAEILWAPAWLFGAIARTRGFFYDRRWLPVLGVPAPVVSVGNLSVGGTGKTPMVGFLVEHFQKRQVRVGVLARGYGRPSVHSLNDEGQMLAARFPELLQVQDKDRVRGALSLLDQGARVIVLDDGFQHRRLHRDLDIVLIDATRPFGLPAPATGGAPVEAPLPRGFLREGLSALRRAHWVVFTRCPDAEAPSIRNLRDRIASLAPQIQFAFTDHEPAGLVQPGVDCAPAGDPKGRGSLDRLRGQTVDLISAIGNPEAFARSAEALGMQIGEARTFGDHHEYQRSDLNGLGERPVVTTAKDWPKLAPLLENTDWSPWVLEVRLRWGAGREALEADLDAFQLPPEEAVRGSLHAGLHG